jgi:iron complex transport system permease protein
VSLVASPASAGPSAAQVVARGRRRRAARRRLIVLSLAVLTVADSP